MRTSQGQRRRERHFRSIYRSTICSSAERAKKLNLYEQLGAIESALRNQQDLSEEERHSLERAFKNLKNLGSTDNPLEMAQGQQHVSLDFHARPYSINRQQVSLQNLAV
mmetsp:Transcript_1515/g.2682  ORF Transcript_1515/g.2682 Transcript_1515/m.2682 type:complete len:109 (-) Transcript_1515:163-489(-)